MSGATQAGPKGSLAAAHSFALPQWTAFARSLEAITGQELPDPSRLHEFSVLRVRDFWRHFLSWAELHWEGNAARVCESDGVESAAAFPDLRLNYAENVLLGSGADPDAIVITSCHVDGRRVRLTRAELQERVEQMGEVLREQGVGVGDRVAAILRNDADAIVTALAVAAIGASLTIAAPETGVPDLMEHFEKFAPRLLIAHTDALPHDTGAPLAARVAQVAAALGSLNLLITLADAPPRPARGLPVRALSSLLEGHHGDEFHWQRFAFNQPLFAQASPGSAGGLLIKHVRQHRLDCDLRAEDRLFVQTSCASPAWLWQLSALASGCEIVLYDGSTGAAGTLRRIVDEERVSLFGTRPPGLQLGVGRAPAPVRGGPTERGWLQREGASLE